MQFEGYIEIENGVWYSIKTTLPYSNRKKIGFGNGGGTKIVLGDTLKPFKLTKRGYCHIKINDNKRWSWQRIVYEHFKGAIPKGMQVDHKDNNVLNNHPDNLVLITPLNNSRKRLKQYNNKSGYTGVYWDKRANKWHCQISIKNKIIGLGYFDNPLEAFICYLENKIYYHGWDSILPIV